MVILTSAIPEGAARFCSSACGHPSRRPLRGLLTMRSCFAARCPILMVRSPRKRASRTMQAMMALCRLGAAEISVADARIVLQRAGGAGENDLAGLEHIGLVRDLEREAGVLLDHENRDTLLVDGADQLQHAVDVKRRQAHGR